MIIALLILALLILVAPAFVGLVRGSFAYDDWEDRNDVVAKRDAALHAGDTAEVDRIEDASFEQNGVFVATAIREAYVWTWRAVVSACQGAGFVAIAKAWPIAFAWAASVYGLAGPTFGWPAPQLGHILIALTGALVFIAARPAAGEAKA